MNVTGMNYRKGDFSMKALRTRMNDNKSVIKEFIDSSDNGSNVTLDRESLYNASNQQHMNSNQILQLVADRAKLTMKLGHGGPFGAAIVKDGAIIALESNSVLKDNDPTAHAEVNAIRKACKMLGTYDLTGCDLYATGAPCPMCMAATIWSNIRRVHVSGLPEDAADIGFRDDFMYNYLKGELEHDADILDVEYDDRRIAKDLYSEYAHQSGVIY